MILDKFSKNLLKKNKGVAITPNLSMHQKGALLQAYSKTKVGYSSTLNKNMRDFISKKISQDEYIKRQKDAISTAFSDTFLLGKAFNVPNPVLADDERRFLVYQTTKEMSFMSNFANDIANKAGRMPYRRRMGMYSSSLEAMFTFGRLAFMPDDVKIMWRLGITDKHCLDCLFFNANNPYTKKTLPGVPKSGHSQCLSNCRCHLQYLYGSREDYNSFIVKNYSKRGKQIPTEEDFIHLMRLKNDFYYYRLQYAMTKNPTMLAQATEYKNQISGYIKRNSLAVSLPLGVAVPVSEVKAFAKNSAFETVLTSTQLMKNDFLSVFIGEQQYYGKVKEVAGNSFIFYMMDGTELLINPSETIVFKEK